MTFLPLFWAILLSGCDAFWVGAKDVTAWEAGHLVDPQVGFLYVGPVGDHGWTKAHHDGRLYLEDSFPELITHYTPSVLPSDANSELEKYVADGDNLIFTTSYDFLAATETVAANNPEVKFESCSGFVSAPNLGSYDGRMYQVFFLAGIVAGYMTETGHIGVVGSVVIPESIRHINAFALGVREVNLKAVIEVQWINNFFDVKLEPVVTQALIDNGADVILSETDTTIPLEVVAAAQESGKYKHDVWSIGYINEDTCDLVGSSCLTSPYWNWGPLYTRIVQQMMDGTWDPYEIVWDQMQVSPEDSTVYLADINKVVGTDHTMSIQALFPIMAEPANSQEPFIGPLNDNQGAMRIAQGDEMQDGDLLSMCWYVDGIVDQDDNPAVVPGGCGGDY